MPSVMCMLNNEDILAVQWRFNTAALSIDVFFFFFGFWRYAASILEK